VALSKFDDAIAAFQAAPSIRPDESRVQLALGAAYATAGKSLEAIDAFKEAIRLDPKWIEARSALARYYGNLGRNEDALRVVSEALLLSNEPLILVHLATIQIAAGALQPAIEVLTRAISL
jgi:Flp pilus assembly protein TadD